MAAKKDVPPGLTPYLHLGQGDGAVYSFPHNGKASSMNVQELNWIGTHGCFTCVCVYIPLGEGQCFAAHIDAHNSPRGDLREWITDTEEEAEELKAYVHKRLTAALPDFALGQYARHHLRSKAIIVCPRRELYLPNDQKKHSTGWAVVEAVRKFFGFIDGSHPTEFAHGFIVNPLTQETKWLKWQDESMSEDVIDRWGYLLMKMQKGKLSEYDEEYISYRERQPRRTPGNLNYIECDVGMKGNAWTLLYAQEKESWGLYPPRFD